MTHDALRITFFALPFILLLTFSPLAADQTISYEAYLALIGDLRQQAQVAITQDAAACSLTLAGVADELAEVTAVQLPNGTTMAVDHSAISRAIRAQPCDGLRASELLAGICPAHVCPVTAVSPDPNQATGSAGDPSQPDPNAPFQPSQDVLDQVEQLLEDAEALATPEANAADPSVEESGQEGSDANAGDLPSDEAAGEGEADGAPGDGAPDDGVSDDGAADESNGEGEGDQPGETGDTSTGESDEGGSSGQNGEEASGGDNNGEGEGEAGDSTGDSASEETGTEGEPGEEEGGTENGGESGEGETGENGDENGGESGAANNGEQPGDESGAETGDENEDAGQTAVQPTSVPPDIAAPEENQTPLWVWILIGFALLALGGGAVILVMSQQPQQAPVVGPREPATSAEAVDVGRELMLAGDYRAAVRHIFLAALLAMDERGVLHYDTTRTNYELLQELQFKPYVVKDLTPVVETFERVWYGFEAVDIVEYDALVGQIDLLKQV